MVPCAFGVGIRAAMAPAAALNRLRGMMLPGKASRVHTPAALHTVVNGSNTSINCPAALNVFEKSPRSCSAVGTVCVEGNGISS